MAELREVQHIMEDVGNPAREAIGVHQLQHYRRAEETTAHMSARNNDSREAEEARDVTDGDGASPDCQGAKTATSWSTCTRQVQGGTAECIVSVWYGPAARQAVPE